MSNNYIITEDGELYHWGVKGMRWGVRRYQNDDGTLTPAGEKRYAKQQSKSEKRQFKADVKEARKHGLKVDYELDTKTGEMEIKQYYNSKNQKVGKDYVDRVFAEMHKSNARRSVAAMLGGTATISIGLSLVSKYIEL